MATLYSQVGYGSRGETVKKLQKLLNQGDYNLDEDGIFGAKTQAAVKDYQKNNGLDVDGIVGNKTWTSLTTRNSAAPETGSADGTAESPSTGAATANSGFNYGAYQESDVVKQAQQMLQEHMASQPGNYQSAYADQINAILDQIMNREKFSYDLNGDALYQQYKDKYTQQGKMAMMDTMGQAQAMTGGYGNSYAQSVGQQAYQGQLQNLNDMVPELYQMALDQYNQEGQDLYNQYSLLGAQEEQDYGRYRDKVSDYYTELSRLMDQYNTERDYDYSKYANERDFAYGEYSDDRAYDYQEDRDKIKDEQWQAEFDEAVRQYNHANGISTGGSSGDTGSSDTGDTGNDSNGSWTTRDTQQMLKDLGYDIAVDGVWGPKTQAAWDEYQRTGKGPEKEPEATLSQNGKNFMNNLPYAHAGTDMETWRNTVRERLQRAHANGTLTDDDIVLIAAKLGL